MKKVSTRQLVLAAMFIALQILFSKFLRVQVTDSVRISIDSVPLYLAALLFGPAPAALIGLAGDFLGTVLFPTAGAWYPPLTLCFGLIGPAGWLAYRGLKKAPGGARLVSCAVTGELIASLLAKSLVLSRLVGVSFPVMLSTRVLPVAVNTALDALLLVLLYGPVSRMLRAREGTCASERIDPASAGKESPMTYEEALRFIHGVDWRGTVFGLDRIRELLSLLGDPQKKLRFVHVAGTNGKGSTSAMLASVFRAAGYRTGLYVSPYIRRFNERIQVDGEDIPDPELARLTAKVRDLTAGMVDKPTEFELVTAIGFEWFYERHCDIVVCEVGMGGRLDATNVIDSPELSVITNIGLDHMKFLGDTLAKIAAEKAGILKPGRPCVCYGHVPEADAVLREAALEKGCPLVTADFDRPRNVTFSPDGVSFACAPFGALRVPLAGTYQLRNGMVVLTAVEELRKIGWDLSDEAVREGLARVRWPGRFEILSREPLVIADGGHNPQGVSAAVESLQSLYPGRPAVLLMGIMADKDVPTVLSLVAPVAARFVCVTPDNPRALPAPELAARLSALGAKAEAAPSVAEGVRLAMERLPENGLVLALGSLYMSQAVRDCFPGRENP